MNRLLLLAPEIARDRLYARAGAVPSFHIAPQRTQSARDLISGRLLGTYNSATPAMAVGADGLLFTPAANEPVIEYDATTRACLGARIWGAATTNLMLQSEDIGSASYIKQNSPTVTTNTGDSPSGTTTADRVSIAPSQYIQQLVNITSGTQYTVSFWLRPISGGTQFKFNVFGAGNNITSSAVTMASGIQRYSYTFTASATGATGIYLPIVDGLSSSVYEVWGAQLNTGPLAPYVPTGALSASSTADVWSITGADAARIINTAEGTLYADFVAANPAANQYPTAIQLQGANRQNEVQIYFYSSNVAYLVKAGNVSQAEASIAATPQNGIKSALRYALNNTRSYANGSPLFLDTSCTMPTTDRIYIGSSNGTENYLNGYIREAMIIRSGRPDANLSAMTQ